MDAAAGRYGRDVAARPRIAGAGKSGGGAECGGDDDRADCDSCSGTECGNGRASCGTDASTGYDSTIDRAFTDGDALGCRTAGCTDVGDDAVSVSRRRIAGRDADVTVRHADFDFAEFKLADFG